MSSASLLTALVLTRDNRATIEGCLNSVRPLARIVVVDSGSQDGTLEICRRLADEMLEHPYLNYGDQLAWSLNHVSSPWVLVVDADECLSDGLAEEIGQRLRSDCPAADGYRIPRRTFFLGEEIKHCGWSPDYVLRLFKRSSGRSNQRGVGATIEVPGRVEKLRGHLLHYSYPTLDVYFAKSHKYAVWSAEEMAKEGRRVSLWQLLARPLAKFIKMYFIRAGFLDGRHGLILCLLASHFVFLKYLRYWESVRRRGPESELL